MGLSKEELSLLVENKVKELQNNVRHTTQLAMNWFTFFVTINYASIGWLAAKVSGDRAIADRYLIFLIAVAFIVQNIVGILLINKVEKEMKKRSDELNKYEQSISDGVEKLKEVEKLKKYELLSSNEANGLGLIIPAVKSIPADLYKCVKLGMIVVLVSLVLAWCGIVYVYIFM
jgi:hypothetical protein